MPKIYTDRNGKALWKDERNAPVIEQMRRFWNEGLTTLEIGRRVGITKNAAIGIARRFGFPGRPSPIGAQKTTWKEVDCWVMKHAPHLVETPRNVKIQAVNRIRVAAGEIRWTVASDVPTQAQRNAGAKRAIAEAAKPKAHKSFRLPVSRAVVLAGDVDSDDSRAEELMERAAMIRAVLQETRRAPVPITGVKECQWPIGEPRRVGFRFCCERVVVGRPYCAEHCRVAYVAWTGGWHDPDQRQRDRGTAAVPRPGCGGAHGARGIG